MQSLLILVAPALFAASIYIILGRIILLVDGERYSLIRQKWLTKTFVAGDVLSFMMQGTGGGIQAMGTLDSMHLGEKVIIGGLFVQLIFFAFFIVVAGIFHHRLVNDRPLNNRPRPLSLSNRARRHRQLTSSSSARQAHANNARADIAALPWKRHLHNLYLASTLIMIRSIFRVIEYIQGNAGYLLSHEVFLYVFDSALMLFVMVSFNWIHPSQITELYQKRQANSTGNELQRTRNELLGQDEARSDGYKTSKPDVRSAGWIPSREP
ncbi:hypothetical protein N0V83_009043 [Neocucurbitaria cava]|uniref:Uncharacterized protein n=1 Tax=Neocucurbitaria cava TaxID=798079 RepID=A0A9W8Y0C4_9PLEO|nr:hypothetical protein N0V83_009043 [Neocucurbitaria cava]